MSRSGIVNVRMVITEEKILSNIAKVQRLIDPNSKKQIVQLEDDAFFKDLVESIKTYLIEYPKKKNFPKSVYKAAYGLVEFATNEFEENTKQIEELIRQREKNIALSGELKDVLNMVVNKEDGWKESIKEMSDDFTEDILDTLGVIGRSKSDKSQNYQDALKLINARIANLESNLHIEIDMERIEDKSKALSYIGIEVADALKLIPAPQEDVEEVVEEKIETVEQPKAQILQQAQPVEQDTQYYESTRVEVKPSLWQRFKQSKFVRTIKYIMKIKVVLDIPALPSADEDRR
ncbi:MAG: hypothetical protein KHW52_03725 [Clostridium sp.]|nr:hypothetical protein [Clostridia bacterium]MBS5681836.1 hypothetical protein [Clostridium sp.]CDA58429.1 unknown [Clostridium sp. CAG:245]